MLDGHWICQFVNPRNRLRQKCVPPVFVPAGPLFTWVSRTWTKLSTRDYLTQAAPAAAPEPETGRPVGTTSPTSYFPIPGFSSSNPVDRQDPANLSYTRPWNAGRVQSPTTDKHNMTNESKTRTNASSDSTAFNPWEHGISDIEFVVAHDLSRQYPDIYRWVIDRACQRAGMPVPSTLPEPPQHQEP